VITRSYVTNLFESRLSCAQRADVYTLLEDPLNVEKRINTLNKVAHKKGKEKYCKVGANEGRFGRRMAMADGGYLGMEETRRGRRVS